MANTVNRSLLQELPQGYLNTNTVPHSFFPRDRIFIVYGHSGEKIKDRGGRSIAEVERAEQQFERFRVPDDTFTATTVPVGLAAPAVPVSIFYTLQDNIKIPDRNKSLIEYKTELQTLGKNLYAKTFFEEFARYIMAQSLNPIKSEVEYYPPGMGEKNVDQQDWERLRTHGPRHISARENTKDDRAAAYYLFSHPKNNLDVFTADSPTIQQGCGPAVDIIGLRWVPSGAMRLTDLQDRFPMIPDGVNPIFIKDLFKNYTFGQIRDNYDNCVSNLIGTRSESDFRAQLMVKNGNMLPATRNLQDLLNEQIEIVKNNIVWNILPIPGTSTVLNETNFYDCKIYDIFNKPMDAETILKYIRRAAGPGPILVIYHACRSYKLEGDIWRNDLNYINLSDPNVKSARSATLQRFGRPLVARTLSNSGQGLGGGGSRKKLKRNRRSKTAHRRK